MPKPNRPAGETDFKDVLAMIKERMERNREFKAQEEMTSEIKKLNNTLTSNTAKKKDPLPKIPSGRDIANALVRSSTVFGRDFSNWVKDTARYTQASNDELHQANKNLSSLSGVNDNSEQLVYLELIADQAGIMSDTVKDIGGKQLIRLDAIESHLTGMNKSLVDTAVSGDRKAFNEGRLQLKAIMDVNTSVKSGTGRITGELVKLRQGIKHGDELSRRSDNENRKDGKNDGLAKATVVEPTKPAEDSSNGSGVLGFLVGAGGMAALGLMKKLLFAPMTLVRGLIGVFTNMKGILPMLGKAGKLLRIGPLALLSSIFEFGKGFYDAKEVLGKKQVTVLDRVRAGFTELLGSFGDFGDWVAKIFGFDTEMGKTVREKFLWISQKPFEWAQSIVDWFKNDLFSGIDRGTSLTDIPGIIAGNLQKQLTDFVTWMGNKIGELWTDTKKGVGDLVDNMKDGFVDNVKKPFLNFINTLTSMMFDILDKFVSVIPDKLGGEFAREKIKGMRDSMTIDVNGDRTNAANVQGDLPNQPATPGPTPIRDSVHDMQKAAPTLSIPELVPDIKLSTQGATVDPSLANADTTAPIPQYGKAAMNTQEIKQAQTVETKVIMPVSQTKNNVNASRNTTVLNSPGLNPGNPMMTPPTLWNN